MVFEATDGRNVSDGVTNPRPATTGEVIGGTGFVTPSGMFSETTNSGVFFKSKEGVRDPRMEETDEWTEEVTDEVTSENEETILEPLVRKVFWILEPS